MRYAIGRTLAVLLGMFMLLAGAASNREHVNPMVYIVAGLVGAAAVVAIRGGRTAHGHVGTGALAGGLVVAAGGALGETPATRTYLLGRGVVPAAVCAIGLALISYGVFGDRSAHVSNVPE